MRLRASVPAISSPIPLLAPVTSAIRADEVCIAIRPYLKNGLGFQFMKDPSALPFAYG
jgi:hypothetical protein